MGDLSVLLLGDRRGQLLGDRIEGSFQADLGFGEDSVERLERVRGNTVQTL